MCGISGIIHYQKINKQDIETVKHMNFVQRHRGPDDEGVYVSDFCALGHRRLAIIDLSRDGHQPFASPDGRYYLTYNGEIYNYLELKEELEAAGVCFRTKTDTEVLLKAYELYGPDCLEKFNGMFAFAVYDAKEQSLFLARDRVGIKPLYYVLTDNRLYFASEIKAFKAVPKLKLSLREQSVFDYLVFNRSNIFDETFFNEVKRIPKGHYAFYTRQGLQITQWWYPEKFLNKHSDLTDGEIFSRVEKLLTSSVRLRLRSDVTVGGCLSGGLDSSVLLGLLWQKNMIGPEYQTFTAMFPGFARDESVYVKDLLRQYPVRHHEVFPTSEAALAQLKDFVYAQDEPCWSPSYYAQFEVMKKAKEENVTVLLDGQGGDENFAGYQYFHGFYLYGLLCRKKYPAAVSYVSHLLARRQQLQVYQTLAFQMLSDGLKKLFLRRQFPLMNDAFFDRHISSSVIYHNFFRARGLNESILRHFQYKLEHLLCFEDRNSMRFAIESRVPYLDHRLVEFLLGVAEDKKICGGETKFLQKQAMGHFSSKMILERMNKVGFETPTDSWLAQKPWQDMGRDCCRDLCASYPFLFQDKNAAVTSAGDLWKIIVLSVWKNQFLS